MVMWVTCDADAYNATGLHAMVQAAAPRTLHLNVKIHVAFNQDRDRRLSPSMKPIHNVEMLNTCQRHEIHGSVKKIITVV